jgi:hypothetical protein
MDEGCCEMVSQLDVVRFSQEVRAADNTKN